jgi:hypothetical protein
LGRVKNKKFNTRKKTRKWKELNNIGFHNGTNAVE